MKKVKELTYNEVIQCNTKEEAEAICKLMDEAGLRWVTRQRYTENSRWGIDEKAGNICYNPIEGTYAGARFYEAEGKTIYQASKFIDIEELSKTPEKPVEDTPKPIDRVTTNLLYKALLICDLQVPESLLDKIIDVVELLEEKGGEVTLSELTELKSQW